MYSLGLSKTGCAYITKIHACVDTNVSEATLRQELPRFFLADCRTLPVADDLDAALWTAKETLAIMDRAHTAVMRDASPSRRMLSVEECQEILFGYRAVTWKFVRNLIGLDNLNTPEEEALVRGDAKHTGIRWAMQRQQNIVCQEDRRLKTVRPDRPQRSNPFQGTTRFNIARPAG